MLIKIKSNKSTASNWLLSVFTLLLLLGAAFSHFFQAPTDRGHDLSKFTALFNSKDLDSLKEITLQNELGTLTISKNLDDESWKIISPRKIDAKLDAVTSLIESLRKIKIKKIFNKDPINLSNFSLNNPNISLKLHGASSEEVETLEIGLTNPIDDSTYVSFGNKDAIFQVGSLTTPIETYDLTTFIDSNIFPSPSSNFDQIDFYKGKNTGRPYLTIKQKEELWLDSSDKDVNQERANDFINSLVALKSQIILDITTEEQQAAIEKYLTHPAYTIVLAIKGKEIVYSITGVINKLPGIKNEKWQSIIITSNTKSYPMIVSKDALNIFTKQQSYFKKMPLKKLFY